jgi:hypothetical protein
VTNELEEKQWDIFRVQGCRGEPNACFFCGVFYRKRKPGCEVEIVGEW